MLILRMSKNRLSTLLLCLSTYFTCFGQRQPEFESGGTTLFHWLNSNLTPEWTGTRWVSIHINKSGQVDSAIVENTYIASSGRLIRKVDSLYINRFKALTFKPLRSDQWVEFRSTHLILTGLFPEGCDQEINGIHLTIRRLYEEEIRTWFTDPVTGQVLTVRSKEGRLIFAPKLEVTFNYEITEKRRGDHILQQIDYEEIFKNIPKNR